MLRFVLSSSYHQNMVTLTSRWHTLCGIHHCNCMSPHSECIKLPAHFGIDTAARLSYPWTKSFEAATSSRNLAPKSVVLGMPRTSWSLQTLITWILTFVYMTSCYLDTWIRLHLRLRHRRLIPLVCYPLRWWQSWIHSSMILLTIILPGELSKQAISEGTKSVTRALSKHAICVTYYRYATSTII